MVTFMVIERKTDGSWRGLGEHQFQISPRVGEHIEMNDDNGIGHIYEVRALIHPLDISANAGDLIIRYIANTTDFRRSI